MTDLQAALALAQWKRLPEFLSRRQDLARFYQAAIGERFPSSIVPRMHASDTYHFRFVLRVTDPYEFMRAGESRGVIFRRPVAPTSLHRLFKTPGAFPVSDAALAELVSIPLYPRLTDAEAALVADVVTEALGGQ